MTIFRKRIVTAVLIFVLGVLPAVSSFAADANFFEAKANYDIYLQGTEKELTVIADVEILRVQEILGRTFLVIRPADFTLNPKEGFILFDAVRAILPNNNVKFQNTGRSSIKF